jgi:hypothetical protein
MFLPNFLAKEFLQKFLLAANVSYSRAQVATSIQQVEDR